MKTKGDIQKQIFAVGAFDAFGTKKEINFLPKIIEDDENIHALTSGFLKNKTWLIVATNKRIIFLDKGLIGGFSRRDIPLNKISSVSYSTSIMFGKIIITSANQDITISLIQKKFATHFANTVNFLINNPGKKPQTQPQKQSQPSNFLQCSSTKKMGWGKKILIIILIPIILFFGLGLLGAILEDESQPKTKKEITKTQSKKINEEKPNQQEKTKATSLEAIKKYSNLMLKSDDPKFWNKAEKKTKKEFKELYPNKKIKITGKPNIQDIKESIKLWNPLKIEFIPKKKFLIITLNQRNITKKIYESVILNGLCVNYFTLNPYMLDGVKRISILNEYSYSGWALYQPKICNNIFLLGNEEEKKITDTLLWGNSYTYSPKNDR